MAQELEQEVDPSEWTLGGTRQALNSYFGSPNLSLHSQGRATRTGCGASKRLGRQLLRRPCEVKLVSMRTGKPKRKAPGTIIG